MSELVKRALEDVPETLPLFSNLVMPDLVLDTRTILRLHGCASWLAQLDSNWLRSDLQTMSVKSLEISNVSTPHTLFIPKSTQLSKNATMKEKQQISNNHILWSGKRLNIPNIRNHFVDWPSQPIEIGHTLFGELISITGCDFKTGDLILNFTTRIVGHTAKGIDGQPIQVHDGVHTAAGLVYIVDSELVPRGLGWEKP